MDRQANFERTLRSTAPFRSRKMVASQVDLLDSTAPFSTPPSQMEQRGHLSRITSPGATFNGTTTMRSEASLRFDASLQRSQQQQQQQQLMNTTANGAGARTTVAGRMPMAASPSPSPSPLGLEASAAAELLGTYVARRRMLEKASQLATTMREEANDVAEFEERNRLLMNGGGGGGGDATARAKLLEAMQHGVGSASTKSGGAISDRGQGSRRQEQQTILSSGASRTAGGPRAPLDVDAAAAAAAAATSEEGAGGADGDVSGTAVSEAEALRQSIQQKCESLDHLRGVQRSIADLDELADVRRQNWDGAFRRQQRKVAQRARSTAGAASSVPETEERNNDYDHQATSSPNQAEANADGESYELRTAFNALIHKGTDEGLSAEDVVAPPPPPSPPARFTSTALAVTLEALGESLAALVEVTDAVCIQATFKARDEEVNLNPHMQSLLSHMLYCQKTYRLAEHHLERFTAGEKALLEGGAFEVDSLREQFLMRKEALTAQEQREKQSEDARNAARTRLQVLQGRMSMWEVVLLGRRGSRTQRTESLSAPLFTSQPAGSEVCSEASSSSLSLGAAFHRAARQRDSLSMARCVSCDDVTTTHAHVAHDEQQQQPVDVTVLGQTQQQANPAAQRSSYYYAGVSRGPVTAADDDALERRLARKWGNPYVLKTLQCEEQDSRRPVPMGYYLRGASEPGSDAAAAADTTTVAVAANEGRSLVDDSRGPDPPGGGRGSRKSTGAPSSAGGGSEFHWPPHTETVAVADIKRDGASPNPTLSSAAVGTSSSAALRATADARLLTLLQNLLRSIPHGGDDGDNASDEDAENGNRDDDGNARKRKVDRDARLSTRNSIQRLVRHLQQQQVAREKESKSTAPLADLPTA